MPKSSHAARPRPVQGPRRLGSLFRGPSPSTASGQVVCGLSRPPAAWGTLTVAMRTDRFLGEGSAQPSTKGSLRGIRGQRADSAEQVPSDGSTCPGSPRPLAPRAPSQGAARAGPGTTPSGKHSVLFPGPAREDQDHDSSCLGGTQQASILQVATLLAFANKRLELSSPALLPTLKAELRVFQQTKPP